MVKAVAKKPQPQTQPRKLNWDRLIDNYTDKDGILDPTLYPLMNFEESVVEPDKVEWIVKMKALRIMLNKLKGKLETNAAYYHIAKILAKKETELGKLKRTGKSVCKAIRLDTEYIAQYFYSKPLAREIAKDYFTDSKRTLETLTKRERELMKIADNPKNAPSIRMKALNDLAQPYLDAMKEGAKHESMNFYGQNLVDASSGKQVEATIIPDGLRGYQDPKAIEDTRKALNADDYTMLQVEETFNEE